MQVGGSAAPSGALHLKVVRGDGRVDFDPSPLPVRPVTFREVLQHGFPQKGLSDEVNEWRSRNVKNLMRGIRRVFPARALGISHCYGQLHLAVRRGNGDLLDYGLASLRVVTDTGVAFIVDAFQNSVEMENMRYHGFGTGGGAEAVGNTALTTELTTQYATDNTRPTGTQTENGANVFRTVATLDPDADVAITEHGLFSQAATGGGVMLDRSLFSVINLSGSGGDTLQATYDFTLTSGS